MLKKSALLVTTLAGTLLLGITAAHAAAPGFYIGGQAGWGDTHYNSEASHATNSTLFNTSSKKETGLAGRIFTGYQFDQNWAVELGYTKFTNATAKYTLTGTPGSIKTSIKEQAIDLVGKGILPLQNGFALYGKLGAAYLDADGSHSGSITGVTVRDSSAHKILPAFGVGVSYDITPNVPVDLSWNRIQKVGNTALRSADFFGLGIAYNFG